MPGGGRDLMETYTVDMVAVFFGDLWRGGRGGVGWHSLCGERGIAGSAAAKLSTLRFAHTLSQYDYDSRRLSCLTGIIVGSGVRPRTTARAVRRASRSRRIRERKCMGDLPNNNGDGSARSRLPL